MFSCKHHETVNSKFIQYYTIYTQIIINLCCVPYHPMLVVDLVEFAHQACCGRAAHEYDISFMGNGLATGAQKSIT